MSRLKLTLAYKGTRFAGWQVQQRPAGEEPRTVQGCVEQALARIAGGHCRVHGAGRTDAGVHALAQVAHVDVPDGKAGINWQPALNHHLPGDVAVVRVERAAPDFHARYQATSKTYAYTLWLERSHVLPQRSHYVWKVGPLDQQAMGEAAKMLQGERNFASFQNTGSQVASSVRNLLAVELVPCESFPELVLRFTATGFLKQMVRNLTGCLVAVGQGRLEPGELGKLLAARDRTQAPATAPAQGLTLERIYY